MRGALSDGAVMRARVSARRRLTAPARASARSRPARPQCGATASRCASRRARPPVRAGRRSDTPLPWPAPSASRTAALRAAALHVISGFGEATMRRPCKEAAAAEVAQGCDHGRAHRAYHACVRRRSR